MDRYLLKELENRDILAREMFWQKEVFLNLDDCDKEYLYME